MTAAPTEDLVGHVLLGRYRVVRAIGRGGMGAIWLARTEGASGFVRPVVIKRILPEHLGDPHLVQMFAREARIMANLRHPGIVSVLDFAEDRGSAIMVLEYVHGYHLGRWRKYVDATRGPFPVRVAVEIVARTLDALHYVHTQRTSEGEPLGIIHRDVSPSNILVDVEGHVKLADFGVARMQTDQTEVSSSPGLKGKLSFLAPEICRLAPATPSSDVYSAGVSLHEVLTGKNEFRAPDPASTITRVLYHPLTPLHLARTDVPGTLAMAVARAVAKEPGERFATAAEFAEALRTTAQELGPAGPEIAEMAAQDFADPRVAEIVGVEPLSVLDRAWREVPTTGHSPPPPNETPTLTLPVTPTSVSSAAGVVVEAAPTGPAAGARARSNWLVPAIVAAVVAGVVVLLGLWAREPQAPAVVLVSSAPKDPPSSEQPAPPPGPGGPGAPASPGDRSRQEHPPARRDTGAAAGLTRAFAERRAEVTRCIEGTPGDIPADAAASVRFRVGTNGRVQSAELAPPAVAMTRAGACILRIARDTTFEAQPAPVTFRIPITVRRRR